MGVVSRYQRVGFHCCGLCGIQRHVVGQFVGSVQAPFCPLVPIGHHGGSFSARGGSSSGKGCLHNRHLLLFLSLSRYGHQPCGCGGQRHRYGEQTHVQSLHVVIFGYGWVIYLQIYDIYSNWHACCVCSLCKNASFFLSADDAAYDAPDVRLEDAKNAVCTSVNFRPVLLLIIQQAPICA